MPTVKVSWEQLEELARKVNKKYPNNTELHFIEWDTDTGAITLGSFGSKVFEEEEDET